MAGDTGLGVRAETCSPEPHAGCGGKETGLKAGVKSPQTLPVCFITLLVLLPVASGFTSGFGAKTSGLLPEVSGNRKVLKLQLVYFQCVTIFIRYYRD